MSRLSTGFSTYWGRISMPDRGSTQAAATDYCAYAIEDVAGLRSRYEALAAGTDRGFVIPPAEQRYTTVAARCAPRAYA